MQICFPLPAQNVKLVVVWRDRRCRSDPDMAYYGDLYIKNAFSTKWGGLRWPGDSQRKSGRFTRIDSHESIRRKKPIFITCERFARIASCDSQFWPPKRNSQKRGSVREPRNDSQESGDSRESANRFARIGPSKGGRGGYLILPFSRAFPWFVTASLICRVSNRWRKELSCYQASQAEEGGGCLVNSA